MRDAIALHLRDLGGPLVAAWRREFAGVDGVTISEGDIFSSEPGAIGPGAPIDIKADAIVSPANSFGFMDGGIDAVYTYQLGAGLQDRLQDVIRREHGGEIVVGAAVIVPTEHADIPWCICAPTMRTPREVADTVNAFLAFRAALRAVRAHNQSGRPPIRSVLCPGMATAVGRMPVHRCARQMRVAWDRVMSEDAAAVRTWRSVVDEETDLLR
jgi:O-acetyl-ADP-ribose deacetylase (regulator of RNase III)